MEATMQALVRIRATGPDPATGTMSVELVDVLGEQLLRLPVGQALHVAAQIVQVVLDTAHGRPDVLSAVLGEPAVTAADLATVFELGRRAASRQTVGRRPAC